MPLGSILGLQFLQQPRPAVGAYVRRGQLNCCDGLQGEGSVFPAAGVQAGIAHRRRGRQSASGCAMRRPVQMSNAGSWFLPYFWPGPSQGMLTKEVTIYRVDGET